jgi:DNA-binding transcriptional regulator YhcF (GntR family)
MKTIDYFNIDSKSRKPKYQQIVDIVKENVANGNLRVGQKIPSINKLSEEFYLSRDTVEKAYGILKKQRVIESIRGKGYYITKTQLISRINVIFLINKLSSYKLRVFNAFVQKMGAEGHVDLHIYHCDSSLFLKLIERHQGSYDYYVIMPHFKTEDNKHISYQENVLEAIQKISPDKLVIMDNNKLRFERDVIEIYQDFENDIYEALKTGLRKIERYSKLFLVYPENTVYPYPKRILHGFRKFCVENHLDFEIINEIYEDIILKKGDLFITIEEADLVNLVKQVRDEDLILGKEIGIISYNDTPLKELLGITVISTDFIQMGEKAAEMILEKKKDKIKNQFDFIDRNSI